MKIVSELFGTKGVYFELEGELDLYSTTELRTKILQAFDSNRTSMILDLSKLTYLDSSGVGILIFILQTLRVKKGKLRVIGLGGTPRKVLEMSNIISLVPLAANRQEAEVEVLKES